MSDVSIPLFYDPADYETAASTLDQLTAQQLWASYLIIAGRIAEIEHPAVTATSDQPYPTDWCETPRLSGT